MVEDKDKEEEIENGLIDAKTIELETRFREAPTGSKKLEVIWESMNYNFKKIRTRQHMNTSAIQRMAMDQILIEKRIEEVSIKQGQFRPTVEKHIKKFEDMKLKNEARWGLISKILGGTGTLIIMVLALLQLISILGGL